MKRVFSWIMIVVLCLGMFAGCKKNPASDPVNADDLKQALAYVKTVYKNAGEKTPKDFQRIGNVPVNGVDYEIVWTANVSDEFIKVVKGTDGMVTIDVNEQATEDVKYELTATVSKGSVSVSHTWKHLLPAAGGSMVSIVEDAYALADGQSMDYEVTLTGKIIAINSAWSDQYKNITVTIAVEGAEDKPIQCYRLAGEGAKDLEMGDIITVTGTLKNYSGTIEFDAGCTLDAVVKGEKVAAPEDPKQILKDAYALAENGALPYEATLTGKIIKINTSYNDVYGNVTVTMVVEGMTEQPIQCYRLAGKGADKIGIDDTITVTGYIVNYKGTVQFGAGCTLDSWKDTGSVDPESANKDNFVNTMVTTMVTDPQEGVAYKFYMNQQARNEILYLTGEMDGYYMATTKDPAKAVDVYYEAVSGGCRLYFMKNGVKTYLAMEKSGTHNNAVFSTSPYTLKWNSSINGPTGKLDEDLFFGTYSKYYTFGASPVSYVTGENAKDLDTKNFVGHLGIVEEKAVEKESAAQQAFAQLKADYYTDAEVVVTAEDFIRKNVYTFDKEDVKVAWSADNDAVTIVDNGDGTVTIKVVRGEADVPYVLTAKIMDGDEELTASWKCSIAALPPQGPRDIVEAAYALGKGESMADTVTLTGFVLEVNTPYNSQYGNVTVTIAIEDMLDKPLTCYRLAGEGADKIDFGDYITVTGKLMNYNDTSIQFAQGCTLDARMTQAELVDKVYALAAGETLPDPYVMIANVISIDDGYSEQYGNITITVAVPGSEDQPIKCYRMKGDGEMLKSIEPGGLVAVFGNLTHYSKNNTSSFQYASGSMLLDYAAPELEEEETKLFVPKVVETPELDTGYKFFLYQNKIGKVLYFAGAVDGGYLQTTDNIAEGTDVYLEAVEGVEGAARMYFFDADGAKQYVEIFKNSSNKIRHQIVAEPTMYYTYDAEAKVYVAEIEGKIYYTGTYNNFETFSASETWRITGDNASAVGVSQFVAQFATMAPAGEDVEPAEPPVALDTPFKYFLYQANQQKALYFAGAVSGGYLQTTDQLSEAVDVYLEDASSVAANALRLYFFDAEGVKQYIEIFKNSSNKIRHQIVAEPTMYYVYDENTQLYVAEIEGKIYYTGTYGTYETFSASETWRVTGDNASAVGVSQFIAQFGTVVLKEIAPVVVETPALETAYKFFLYQAKQEKTLYFAGAVDGGYLQTTTDITEATDIILEAVEGVEGAARMYFFDADGAKQYIEIFKNSSNKIRHQIVAEPTMYYTYDAEAKVYVAEIEGKIYYTGTYNNFETFSASETWRITGDNASAVGVSQFVAQFATVGFVEN